ncbi:MAG TPA: hypothetical protein VM166_14120 [Gemmatimonadaceae bacterium]|nr:hypothetical protein [Gemmatimonadaceae bacterium]
MISPAGSSVDEACSATRAEGIVSDATSETITFGSFRHVDAAGKSCAPIATGRVTLGADDEVRIHRFSSKRTLLLLGTIAGLLALAISQAEVGFGPGSNPGCGIVC